MKLGKFLILALIASTAIAADIKISQLPLGSAPSVGTSDSFPYVDATSGATKRLRLSTIVSLPQFTDTNYINTILPSQATHNGAFLKSNASAASWALLTGPDLPFPSLTSLGGIQAVNAVSSQWINSISTLGVPTLSQPAFSDISGTVANAQTTGTALNASSTLVLRDGSGNFAAGTISAALSGNATTSTALASNPADCGANTYATTIDAGGNLTCGSITNASTTATAFNSPSTIVLRDPTGNFAAGTITAALSGNSSTSTALASNPTDCGSNTYATTIDASGNLTCASITNASTTATSANTASTIVSRDGSGNFSAGTISAALSGNATTSTALASNPSDCSAGQFANAIDAQGNLTCGASYVASIAKSGSTALTGAVTLSQGTGVTLTQVGNDISIASSGSSSGGVKFSLTGATVPFVDIDGPHYQTATQSLTQVYVSMLNSGTSGSTTIQVNQYRSGALLNSATASLASSSGNPAGSQANLSGTLSLAAGDIITIDVVSVSSGSPESLSVEY